MRRDKRKREEREVMEEEVEMRRVRKVMEEGVEMRRVKQERERVASEERIANAPNALRRALQGRPKRPTPKRLQTYFLRQFERSGSVWGKLMCASTNGAPCLRRWRICRSVSSRLSRGMK